MAAQVPSRLYRSRSQKMIAGVSGGLGEYFDVDPVLIRLLFVVTAFISGVGILAYIVLWIVVPFEGDNAPRLDALRRDFDDLSGRVREYVDPVRAGWGGGPGGASAPGPAAAGPTAPAGGTPPSVDPVGSPGPAAETFAGPAAAAAASPPPPSPDTLPYEGASMTSDSSTGRLPRHDEPAPAGDPVFGPEPVTEPRAAYVPPHATPTSGSADAPFGAPVGAPPPYWHTAAPADRRRRRQHWAGAILIIIGLLILGSNLGLLRWARPEYVLPLILVVAGAWLLFGRGRRG